MNGRTIKSRSPDRHSSGFTLLEFAMVMIIAGLLLAPALQIYAHSLKQKAWTDTKNNVDMAMSAIMGYRMSGALQYPCPADRSLPETDPNYGLELRGPPGIDPITGLPSGPCLITATAPCNGSGNGVCRATNGYDTDGNGTGDNVLIGGLPFKSLDLAGTTLNGRVSQKTALDGYHHKLEYAVTELMTQRGTYGQKREAIIVNQQDGTTAIVQSTTPGVPNKGAHYVVFSHGVDGKGAFGQSGALISACGTLTAAADNENCNDDAIFKQGVGNIFAAGANYYDDYVKYGIMSGTNLWTETSFQSPDIMNTNSGNVGINTDTPQQRLDIAGTLISNENIEIESHRICDSNGANCFPLEAITAPLASAPIQCTGANAGKPMDGISLTNEVCSPVAFQPLAAQTCPGAQHLVGIKTDGTIVCE